MCEKPKIPKIHYYNRDKMGIIQNEVVWNQNTGEDFRYVVNFAIIAKISLCTVTFAMIAKFLYLSEKLCIAKFSQGLRNFRYGCQIFAILAKFLQSLRNFRNPC